MTNVEEFIPENRIVDMSNLDRHMSWVQNDIELSNMFDAQTNESIDFFDKFSYIKAVDGLSDSAWKSSRNMKAGDWIALDKSGFYFFKTLKILSGNNFSISKVETSLDSKHWTNITKRVTIYEYYNQAKLTQFISISLLDPEQLIAYRFVKVTIDHDYDLPWFIFEMNCHENL